MIVERFSLVSAWSERNLDTLHLAITLPKAAVITSPLKIAGMIRISEPMLGSMRKNLT